MTKSGDITKMALKEWSRVEQRKNIYSGYGLSSGWKLPNVLCLVKIELSSLDWVLLNVD